MRSRRVFLCSFALAALCGAPATRAWNNTGHEIIANIAWQNLSPAAREKITALLHAHPDYAEYLSHSPDPANADLHAFELAATWPDWVRTPGRPQYRYNHP